MERMTASVLALVLVLGVSGCSGGGDDGGVDAAGSSETDTGSSETDTDSGEIDTGSSERDTGSGGGDDGASGGGLGEDCKRICMNTGDNVTLGCVEGSFEQQGYPNDSTACDEWENEVGRGSGSCETFETCKSEQGFSESDCANVVSQCSL